MKQIVRFYGKIIMGGNLVLTDVNGRPVPDTSMIKFYDKLSLTDNPGVYDNYQIALAQMEDGSFERMIFEADKEEAMFV